jgi:hypothetical protein
MSKSTLAAVFTVALLGSAGANAAPARQQFTIYAKATQVQFVNHADDRARGNVTNPFSADTKLPPPPTANSGKKGARAGDNALLSFKLYRDPSLKKRIGSAVYSCTFNFAHNALCEETFELNDGTMFAAGPVDLDAASFTIAVTGGTSRYFGVRGEINAGPAGKDAHRLRFVLR